MERSEISLNEILRARGRIHPYIQPTPLVPYPLLSRELGCSAHIKHENHNPTGSFKVRGGFNFIQCLSDEERKRGVITVTRGNHGQSIALAAQRFGVRCVVVVPFGNNPEKNLAIQAYGAELIEHGRDFDEARIYVQQELASQGLRFVHPANELELVNGVGTYALEILEDLPDVQTIIVPVGGGSGICGTLAVAKTINPSIQVIGVQAEAAPVIYQSWKHRRRVEWPTANTFADGLATRATFDLTFNYLAERVDDIVTVTEEEIKEAVRRLLRTTHNVAEGAGAAAVAAGMKLRDRLQGQPVVMVLSGGNIDTATLKWVLAS